MKLGSFYHAHEIKEVIVSFMIAIETLKQNQKTLNSLRNVFDDFNESYQKHNSTQTLLTHMIKIRDIDMWDKLVLKGEIQKAYQHARYVSEVIAHFLPDARIQQWLTDKSWYKKPRQLENIQKIAIQ